MTDRLRETAGHDRDLEVRHLMVGARASEILVDPTFWDECERQMQVEPIPSLVAQMGRRS